MDWKQLWEIASAPDNVPIVVLIPLLAFYVYLAVRQARASMAPAAVNRCPVMLLVEVTGI